MALIGSKLLETPETYKNLLKGLVLDQKVSCPGHLLKGGGLQGPAKHLDHVSILAGSPRSGRTVLCLN